jgi:hypothetical protein
MPVAVVRCTCVELFSDDTAVVVSPYDRGAGGDAREADARLRIGIDLEVGYGGVYECPR